MTENLPDEELTVVGDEPDMPVDPLEPDPVEPESLDPVLDGRPDSYSGAAENDPDHWQEDPLLQDEPGVNGSAAEEDGIPVGEEGEQSDQQLREETAEARYEDGEEQVPPEEPRIGEAASDVDFGMMEDDESDGSDDPANRGGSSLSAMDEPDIT